MKPDFLTRRRALTVLPILALLLGTTAAAAQTPGETTLDAVLRERATQLAGRSRVIVEFAAAPDVRVFPRGGAGRRVGERAQVGEIDNRMLAAVAADPRVVRVMIDRPAFPTLDRTGRTIGSTVMREEYGVTGKGVGVAIIDSGITSYHDDLYRTRNRPDTRRVAHFRDFTRASGSTLWAGTTELPHDEYGHGTHVAGIIAGNGVDSRGARAGVAPGAHLIGLKVLDAEGNGYVSDVIAAIDYAIAVKAVYNVRVINLSVASAVIESYNVDPLALAARRAVEAGIVVVAASGNLGRNAADAAQFGGITSPGNAPWVLTVGASTHQGTAWRSDDDVAGFSSRGPSYIDFAAKPDLVAPGVGIESLSDPHSTLYATFPDFLIDGAVTTWYKPYLSLTGTSMAAPVVSGTIALMLQLNPDLTPNAVKAILQYTAQIRPGEHVLAQGAGMLNARGAVRLAAFFGSPRSGVPAGYRDTIEGEDVAWARHIIWGNYRVVGGVPLPGRTSTAWATDVTWGALTTPAGQPVVWGARTAENIVWSTTADENIVWSTAADENIVWSTAGADENIVWSTAAPEGDENIVWSTGAGEDANIVWSTATVRNVVWGTDCGGRNCRGVVWGANDGTRVWGTASGDENIVWSTTSDENIVWSTAGDENIVWSTLAGRQVNWSRAAR